MDDQILRTIRVVRARQLQATSVICLLVAFITRHRLSTKKHANLPTRDEILQRRYVQDEMLRDLSNNEEDSDKDLEDEVLHEVLNGPEEEERHSTIGIREGSTEATQLRNSIANEMWTNYLMLKDDEIDMSN
ncbi:hypothetical protein L1987_60723 [Smallanthus sonchifolius]|uniref:Uncharacterized protein n=1 Tax=Smallanthus sonchifolius TaxID=185202 RepID=A0ACB9D9M1_9ASTR|nr:hypothetical protein L1987_60723 [Smallanthus sonchifolius]